MRRRVLLATIGATSVGSLAGCSEMLRELNQNNSPVPEIQELLHIGPRLISNDNPETGVYTVKVQNSGDGGNVGIALFWKMHETFEEPDSLDFIPTSGAWERELLVERFFEAGERRTVEFTRFSPADPIQYMFLVQTVTYGARIHNSGIGGQVRAKLQYKDSQPGNNSSELPIEKTLFIGEDSTEQVRFNAIIPEGKRWEIEVNPA